ncbi:MAG: CULLIN-2 domain-containing protein [Oscillospiraceae bacterium]
MDEIKQIFCSDNYEAFLQYCEIHGYKRMRDLINCRFEELPELIGISPMLLSRIKAICVLYFKQHPECFAGAKKQKTNHAAATDDLKDRLLVLFQQNADRLIHISEITKAIGKGVKRSDIIHVLEHQKWCKIVDATTFFYAPMD